MLIRFRADWGTHLTLPHLTAIHIMSNDHVNDHVKIFENLNCSKIMKMVSEKLASLLTTNFLAFKCYSVVVETLSTS